MKKIVVCLLLLVVFGSASFATFSSTISGKTKTLDSFIVYGTFTDLGTSESTIAIGRTVLGVVASNSTTAAAIKVRSSGTNIYVTATTTAQAGSFIVVTK